MDCYDLQSTYSKFDVCLFQPVQKMSASSCGPLSRSVLNFPHPHGTARTEKYSFGAHLVLPSFCPKSCLGSFAGCDPWYSSSMTWYRILISTRCQLPHHGLRTATIRASRTTAWRRPMRSTLRAYPCRTTALSLLGKSRPLLARAAGECGR